MKKMTLSRFWQYISTNSLWIENPPLFISVFHSDVLFCWVIRVAYPILPDIYVTSFYVKIVNS